MLCYAVWVPAPQFKGQAVSRAKFLSLGGCSNTRKWRKYMTVKDEEGDMMPVGEWLEENGVAGTVVMLPSSAASADRHITLAMRSNSQTDLQSLAALSRTPPAICCPYGHLLPPSV